MPDQQGGTLWCTLAVSAELTTACPTLPTCVNDKLTLCRPCSEPCESSSCTAADHGTKSQAARLLGKARALTRQRRRKARVRAAHAQPAQCRARVSLITVLVDCLAFEACLRLSRAQRRTRDDSLVTAACPGRHGPVPLAGPAPGRRSSVIGVAQCGIARGRPPLVGLAARLGGRSCRGWGGMLSVGSTAASAT